MTNLAQELFDLGLAMSRAYAPESQRPDEPVGEDADAIKEQGGQS